MTKAEGEMNYATAQPQLLFDTPYVYKGIALNVYSTRSGLTVAFFQQSDSRRSSDYQT